ncbi:RHS repeat-associated core domain-containing protein [Armatimonas sp.]|uniref:RHS repeat-associated core domain-containing protein n=1 Tax=Armatimonas sp. TaxID=1872638 RepID=UPI00375171A2
MDTSQPYAEVIQEKTWITDGAGTPLDGNALIYRYDIGLDRLHYFKYQMPINGPPTLGSASFDGLGSTRMLVDDFGTVVDEFGYADAFGIPYRVVPGGGRAVAGPGFFLNGQQWDGGSGWGGANWSGSPAFNAGEGLYFNRARYYQPGLGRFIGEDPEIGKNKNPDSQHRYFYAYQDSVNEVDPSGKFGEHSIFGIQATAFLNTSSSVGKETMTVSAYLGIIYTISQITNIARHVITRIVTREDQKNDADLPVYEVSRSGRSRYLPASVDISEYTGHIIEAIEKEGHHNILLYLPGAMSCWEVKNMAAEKLLGERTGQEKNPE